MGRLLEDMTRLAAEIRTLRKSRGAFRKELADGNRERQMNVFEMCTDFADTQTRMTTRSKDKRLTFLKSLRQSVGDLHVAMGADIAGARRAWARRGA